MSALPSTVTFPHIGDTHLHQNARQADRLRALDQIIGESLALPDLGAWLWPGDLFHQRSTIDDRNALKERVKRMADVAPVVICYGNHDLPGDLDIFGDLGARWPILVVSTPQVLRVSLATGHTASIFALPYPTEAGLVSRGVSPGEMVPTAHEALEAIFLDAGAQLEEARLRGDLALAIGHVNVAGSITSVGQPNIGKEIEIDGYLVGLLGPCYVGLNHIHKAQAVGGAHYPGSVCRLDWGEVEPKGYLLAQYRATDITTMGDASPRYLWTHCVETRPVDVRPMFHIEGRLTRDGFTYKVVAGPGGAELAAPPSWKGCEVRVTAHYPKAMKGMLELSKAHIHAEFAEAFPFQVNYHVEPEAELRASAVAAARTLAEKVGAWAQEGGIVLPEAALAVLPDLEHGDAQGVIAAERARMEALLADGRSEMEAVA